MHKVYYFDLLICGEKETQFAIDAYKQNSIQSKLINGQIIQASNMNNNNT